MKKNLYVFGILLLLTSELASAQFTGEPMQTYFVCNAAGSQVNVHAFNDGNNGSYVYWIDKRNGNTGSAIYFQHLDSLGVPQFASNGIPIYQANSKEIWDYRVVPWQNGALITWVQGGFGVGGDTLLCDYVNFSGNSFWAQPLVVSRKTGTIIYVDWNGLNIFPNDSGATIAYSVVQTGGSEQFAFNRIDFAGNLHWPVNTFLISLSGHTYVTQSDGHNGFFIAASTGGLGAHIFAQHFNLQGSTMFPSQVDVSVNAGGRGNSAWTLTFDADTNLYVLWENYTPDDLQLVKLTPHGSFAWSPEYKTICGVTGSQAYPYIMMSNNFIYATWSDGRPPSANYSIYTQKLDTAGTPQWSVGGILVSNLNSYIPYAKLIAAENGNVVNTYVTGSTFRAQKIHPDSSVAWQTNGIAVLTTSDLPFYGDYKLVPGTDGSVTAFWTTSADICGAKITPQGTLVRIGETEQPEFQLFPNPATDLVTIAAEKPASSMHIGIYNVQGQEIIQKDFHGISAGQQIHIPVSKLSSGLYFVNIISGEKSVMKKFIVNSARK